MESHITANYRKYPKVLMLMPRSFFLLSSIYPPIYERFYLFIHLSIYVLMYLSIYVFIYLCIFSSIYSSIHLCIYVFIYLCMFLSIYLSMHLSSYRQSIHPYIHLQSCYCFSTPYFKLYTPASIDRSIDLTI